jgi:hypothetical protein
MPGNFVQIFKTATEATEIMLLLGGFAFLFIVESIQAYNRQGTGMAG